MAAIEEEITITGTVREVSGGIALVNSSAEQSGSRIIRNAEAELTVD